MIALSPTDNSWFQFLRTQPNLSLVNFWTPHDWNIKSLDRGAYWYFVLKGTEPRKIGGGGRFLEYKFMKASKAWELYGIGNGSSSFQEMVGLLNKHIKPSLHSKDPEIGCVVLDSCVFLPDSLQRTSSELGLNFPRHVVKFKTFDSPPLRFSNIPPITEGVDTPQEEYIPSSEEDARKRIETSIVRRQGQPKFRRSLLTAYENKCAVTECDVVDALEAAHITPYMGEQTNSVQNGLLLRADIHMLFDLGQIAIESNDFRIILNQKLRTGYYGALHGKMISVPRDKSAWPSKLALDKHKKDSGL